MKERRHREEAAAQTFAFMIAGVVLVGSVGGVLWSTSHQTVDSEAGADTTLHLEAQLLMQVLMDADPDEWDDLSVLSSGDQRINLKHSGGGLSMQKMHLMRGSSLRAHATNGLLDYDESRVSLGVAEGSAVPLQYHLRIYPVGLNETLAQLDLSNIRTGYIGAWGPLSTVTVQHSVNQPAMVKAANHDLNATMELNVEAERQMLRDLGLDFKDQVHITTDYPQVLVEIAAGVKVTLPSLVSATLIEGDVYPDNKRYLQNTLADRLPMYDLLVIGSDVDHESLTANAIKNGIADWVYDGGTLIVLGTDSQHTQWMQPMFGIGARDGSGNGATASDLGHPVLKTPYDLNWDLYPVNDVVWDVDSSDEGLFQRIILDGEDEVFVISEEGALGQGRLFLTAFQPKAIAGALGMDEGRSFFHNMIVYVDKEDLYLDYGPTVPGGVTVAAAVRHAYVQDDDLGRVPVRVELLLWRAP